MSKKAKYRTQIVNFPFLKNCIYIYKLVLDCFRQFNSPVLVLIQNYLHNMYLVILLNWVFCIFLTVARLSFIDFIYLSLYTFMYNKTIIGFRSPCCQKRVWNRIRLTYSDPFLYPEPFLRAIDRARRGALAKSITE